MKMATTHLVVVVSCSTVKQPLGWTLPSFSWYIDQTIAGAISTATHGSTLKFGSMSNLVCAQLSVLMCRFTLIQADYRCAEFAHAHSGIVDGYACPSLPSTCYRLDSIMLEHTGTV